MFNDGKFPLKINEILIDVIEIDFQRSLMRVLFFVLFWTQIVSASIIKREARNLQ